MMGHLAFLEIVVQWWVTESGASTWAKSQSTLVVASYYLSSQEKLAAGTFVYDSTNS